MHLGAVIYYLSVEYNIEYSAVIDHVYVLITQLTPCYLATLPWASDFKYSYSIYCWISM